ncbi:MAG: glycosyltransferase family 2 protein [Blautia sp.]|nr:glycosyltransferase family 2 protein [Blautia sp.]MCM1199598.1 glycosyltransferase family 2 protein [Bacteroides fragilis]
MSSITILTPTYNRADLLPRLYESLCGQSCMDFDWMVIDDGSQDDTEALIQRCIQEKTIPIYYEKQRNAGKHNALNRGIAQIKSGLTFIVDSDDYLTPDAVETILSYHQKYRDTDNLCGYSFLRCHRDGRVNTAYFPEDEKLDTYLSVRINGNIGGDKAEVFYTDILRKYPFPVFEGEKYMPEDVVWMRMSGPYRMLHVNKGIYICDYLEGGLTRTGRRMKIHSPRGMMLRSEIYLNTKETRFKVKVKMMLLYQIYGRFAGCAPGELRKKTGQKRLWTACYLPSLMLYWKWKKEYGQNTGKRRKKWENKGERQ